MLKNIFPFEDFLYILQLEEYYYERFFPRVIKLFLKRGFQINGNLVFTSRIKLTYFLSILLTFYFPTVLFFLMFSFLEISFPTTLFTLLVILSVLFIPIHVGIASLILEPFYNLIKKNLQRKARKAILSSKSKNIMIVGSYGKTTVKNMIQQLIQFNYKVQMVPGNINTPTGIASWIIKFFDKNTEILIAETDGYKLGEIKDCCLIIPPDYVIITAIGDQHLERLGSKKRLAETLLEALRYSRDDAKYIVSENTVRDFSSLGFDILRMFDLNKFVILDTDKEVLEYKEKLLNDVSLSEVNRYNIKFALKISEVFDIPEEFVKDTIKDIKLPERRNEKIVKDSYITIDSSYNISFNTAKASVVESLNQASRYKRGLIIITGGIPELGEENIHANEDYGKFLAKKGISKIIILETSLAVEVLKGLKKGGYQKENIIFAKSMNDAWSKVSEQFNPKKYIFLMQPELNDLYYIDTNFSTMSVE